MHSGAFLQSKEWAKFQESLGRKIFWVDGVLIIKMPLPLGLCYLYSPKAAYSLRLTADSLIQKIKEIAKKEKAIFWRVEPSEAPPKEFIKIKDTQPKCTLITDISKPESELLATMHEKTRYNLRLSERKGVGISNFQSPISNKNFEEFYDLLQKTSARQKIKLHSKNYYKKLAEFNEVFIAYHENVPVAAAMVNFYGDTATYLHGGSDEKYKNLMAPQLLHWEIIKIAKLRPVRGDISNASNGARGIKFYDWWGIDEKKWPGITRFKKGFGGAEICAPGTYDLPLDKFWYWVYKIIRK